MKLYKLPFVMREPGQDTEGKVLAEIPSLPGRWGWGDTAAEALENLQSVAAAFIESYKSRGDPLPEVVSMRATEAGSQALSEVLVAV